MATVSAPPLQPRRLSTAEWFRLGECGFFEDERVELLDGLVVPMSPIGNRHLFAVDLLNRALVLGVPGTHMVRPQGSLRLRDGWVPEPDLFVYGRPEDIRHLDPLLIVEVSASSLRKDRMVKLPEYAQKKAPEYWIVNLVDLVVEVHRDPDGLAYRSREVVDGGRLRSSSVPSVEVDLDELFSLMRRLPPEPPEE